MNNWNDSIRKSFNGCLFISSGIFSFSSKIYYSLLITKYPSRLHTCVIFFFFFFFFWGGEGAIYQVKHLNTRIWLLRVLPMHIFILFSYITDNHSYMHTCKSQILWEYVKGYGNFWNVSLNPKPVWYSKSKTCIVFNVHARLWKIFMCDSYIKILIFQVSPRVITYK